MSPSLALSLPDCLVWEVVQRLTIVHAVRLVSVCWDLKRVLRLELWRAAGLMRLELHLELFNSDIPRCWCCDADQGQYLWVEEMVLGGSAPLTRHLAKHARVGDLLSPWLLEDYSTCPVGGASAANFCDCPCCLAVPRREVVSREIKFILDSPGIAGVCCPHCGHPIA